MSHLPPLSLKSSHREMHMHLAHLQETALQPITLCDEAITYNSSAHQKNWDGTFADNKDTKPLRYFLKYPMPEHHIRAALFSTDTVTWVGKQWNPERPFHAWAVVLVGKLGGKRGRTVLIWDPIGEYKFTKGRGILNHVLLGSQRNLISKLGGKNKLDGVWYSKEGRNAEDECLKMSVEWLGRLMRDGVPEDLEAAGFVKI